jgi:hypothetical protein
MLKAAFPEIGRKLFKGLLNENEERIELLIFRPMSFQQSSSSHVSAINWQEWEGRNKGQASNIDSFLWAHFGKPH